MAPAPLQAGRLRGRPPAASRAKAASAHCRFSSLPQHIHAQPRASSRLPEPAGAAVWWVGGGVGGHLRWPAMPCVLDATCARCGVGGSYCCCWGLPGCFTVEWPEQAWAASLRRRCSVRRVRVLGAGGTVPHPCRLREALPRPLCPQHADTVSGGGPPLEGRLQPPASAVPARRAVRAVRQAALHWPCPQAHRGGAGQPVWAPRLHHFQVSCMSRPARPCLCCRTPPKRNEQACMDSSAQGCTGSVQRQVP